MSSASAKLDQMELDLKRLRQESEQFSATIQQLEARDAQAVHGPQVLDELGFLGVQGMVLGGALVLGGVLWLWRLMALRVHMRPQDFVESSLYRADNDARTLRVSKSEALAHVPGASWDETSDWVATPSTQESLAPESTYGFDVDAAAYEVERVRKSLAERRAQRELLRNTTVTSAAIDAAMAVVMPDARPGQAVELPPATAPSKVLADSELEFDLDVELQPAPAQPIQKTLETSTPEPEPELLAAAPLPLKQSEPWVDSVVPESPVAPVDSDGPVEDALSVKFALAQEFYALGLSLQARELAAEVIESGHLELALQAHELVALCQVQEQNQERQKEHYGALVESLREVPPSDEVKP